jgi:hypothetical protein
MNTLPAGRGCYRYLCNDEPAGVEETWEIQHRDGECHIQSVRFARSINTRLRVRSVHRDENFSSCSLHWRRQLTDQAVEVSADYCFDSRGASAYIHNGSEEIEWHEPDPDFLFSPLMRIYNGPVIRTLCARGESRVLVPWIKNTEQVEKIFHPDYSVRQAQLVRDTELRIGGNTLACKEYEYNGGEYQPGTRFWVDPKGVMLRYSWQQDQRARWEISLTDYHLD